MRATINQFTCDFEFVVNRRISLNEMMTLEERNAAAQSIRNLLNLTDEQRFVDLNLVALKTRIEHLKENWSCFTNRNFHLIEHTERADEIMNLIIRASIMKFQMVRLIKIKLEVSKLIQTSQLIKTMIIGNEMSSQIIQHRHQ